MLHSDVLVFLLYFQNLCQREVLGTFHNSAKAEVIAAAAHGTDGSGGALPPRKEDGALCSDRDHLRHELTAPPFSHSRFHSPSPSPGSFIGHLREVRRGCRQGHPPRGLLDNLVVVRLPQVISLFIQPMLSPSGSKRPPESQGDTPERKRRRPASKRIRPATSETETLQSSSGSPAPFNEESDIVALRKTLQQVQEDVYSLREQQRQLDGLTRGIQHNLGDDQPRHTLRFLEEHFMCVL